MWPLDRKREACAEPQGWSLICKGGGNGEVKGPGQPHLKPPLETAELKVQGQGLPTEAIPQEGEVEAMH